MPDTVNFQAPTLIERWFNRIFGVLAARGIGRSHNYQLSVLGRKSGKRFSTPVNLTHIDGKNFLVAPRGKAQWVQNIRASNELWLKRGSDDARYIVEEISGPEKTSVLREYLQRYSMTVQRYFSVQPGSSDPEFDAVAHLHPVFQLRKEQ